MNTKLLKISQKPSATYLGVFNRERKVKRNPSYNYYLALPRINK